MSTRDLPGRGPHSPEPWLWTGTREVEPELYVDASQSEGWPWDSDPSKCTWLIQLYAIPVAKWSTSRYAAGHGSQAWLADGLAGRAPKTVSTQREVLEPLIDIIGGVPLRELSAANVRTALKDLAATRATRTVAMTHAGLARAIRHAEANDKVRRNVATLVDTPAGQEGRPSKSLTFEQSAALIRAARSYGLYAYVVLSLLVGIRTEEARALRWDHVDLEGDPDAHPPVPPHVDVWRSVRVHGDTKTKKSRRSLGLPRMAVEALVEHRRRQAVARQRAGVLWQDNGLVFTTALGTRLDAADVRRSLRTICRKAALPGAR